MKRANGTLTGTRKFKKVRIKGGGWNVHVPLICDDGTIGIRTDTTEPFRLDPGSGTPKPLFRAGVNIPYSQLANMNIGMKNYELTFCLSNSNYGWAIHNNALWFTSTKGEPTAVGAQDGWERVTNWTNTSKLSNGGDRRLYGSSMQCDPANGQVCCIGAEDGVYMVVRTAANTFTVTKVTGPPACAFANDRRPLIAYDRSSSVVSGKTQGLAVFIATGASTGELWKSANGGSTWTKDTACTIGSAGCLRISPVDGTIWLGGPPYLGDAPMGRWTSANGWAYNLINCKNVAVHPTIAGRVIATGQGGTISISTNNGGAWPNVRNGTRTAVNDPWLAKINESYMSNGNAELDPLTGDLVFGFGIGLGRLSSPFTATNADAVFAMIQDNIDQLIMQVCETVHKPGHVMDGAVLASFQDRTGIARKRYEIFSPVIDQAPNHNRSIYHGGQMTYADSDPNILFLTAFDQSGSDPTPIYKSRDGGRSWAGIGKPLRGLDKNDGVTAIDSTGGNIVAFTENDLLYLPTRDIAPQWSSDGGATWAWCAFPGVTPGPLGVLGGHTYYWSTTRKLAVDRRNPLTAYLLLIGSSGETNPAKKGWFKTTDGGKNWVRRGDIPTDTNWDSFYFHSKLKCNPLVDNQLMHCGSADTLGFRISTDGAMTWRSLTTAFNITGPVASFDFGKPRTDGDHPTIYFAGSRGGAYGNFAVHGFNPTDLTFAQIEQLEAYPFGELEGCNDLSADKTVYGRTAQGTGGAGMTAFYYDSVGTLGPA